MLDIQCVTAEDYQGKKRKKKKAQGKNMMSTSAMQGDHNKLKHNKGHGVDVICTRMLIANDS